MITMKRFLAIVMALALLILAACADEFAPVGSTPEPSSLETAESKPTLVVVNDDPAPNTPPPAFMLNDILYYSTGREIYIEVDEADYLGRTISSSLSELPSKNGEANLVFDGAPYVKYKEGYAILMDTDLDGTDEWIRYEAREPESELDPYELYYDYFSSNFAIIEYKTVHGGSSQLWGHSVQNETRATKQIYVQQIDGFDYPVLVLAEFTLGDDGITLVDDGLLHAYLIKDGKVTSNLDRTEFDAIFKPAGESEGGGWATRYEDDILSSVIPTGERLFALDFTDGGWNDGKNFDKALAWLAGEIR